ncbi:MAG: flagellar biosynthetic protein FliR [Candidatus Binatia bacterium]
MPIPDPVPFLLVLARLSGLVLAAPIFGHLLVPMRVRAGFVGIVALALAPVVGGPRVEPTSLWGLAALVAMEGAVGVLIGFVAQLVFAGVLLGGQVVGLQVGFGIADLIDPSAQAQATVVAQWQQLAALLVFLVLDVHHVVLRALLESFRVAPVGHVVLSGAILQGTIAQAASLFAVGVRIAAPVLITLLLVNGALGVLARTIPQLNVFAVGLPVNVGVGLVVLGASLPFTVRFLVGQFDDLGRVLETLVESLGALAHA